ncbi:HET-domain-containing protein [Cucurbitaria berberidis CBS 394.84]|uniref:HET-domain-containing protein n=1 Tax=Cucurbitaria berberidis CBS 394.84 TaxID=1168544 RepID=A0A9P4GKA3_9PLEO|nr:HET-domain-containing protein [Cucurbitaria berberidis CBS 394.84]KAF1847863.1 HET-domain-containing protein [Cucurbitaria berberidis CBS 394.84]
MSLCKLCNSLSIARLYPPNVYPHAENLAALEASANDCRLCKMIHWCIERGGEREHHPQLNFEGASDEPPSYGEHEARDKCAVKLQIIPGHWNAIKPQKGFTHVGIWLISKWMTADLTLSVEEGDELGMKTAIAGEQNSFISGRVLVNETPPQAHFDVAKRWLDHCEANHSECAGHNSRLAELPSRVICVAEEGQDPHLVSGNGERARYATLSHCWGRSTATITTTESLRKRQDSIPLETIPKTFKDAILVCRKLGMPYLWIDSLCIIQDDKDDWERESGHMGSIYYDSTLTIAATDSPDSSRGLFIPRRPYEYCYYDIVRLPSSFGDHKGQAYLTASTWGVYGPPASNVENGILQTRGWVMQEKYLARRTLHFLAGQMVWICCERILGQSGFNESLKNSWRKSPRMQMKAFAMGFERSYRFADLGEDRSDYDESDGEDESNAVKAEDHSPDEKGVEEDSEMTSEPSHFVTILSSPEHGRASYTVDLRDPQYQNNSPLTIITRQIDNELYNFLDAATRQTIYHVWYSAVAAYSERRLTFASDKLPALAGIASRVQAITHDQYLAGHWCRELERSLFWQTSTEPDTWTPARVKKYRAPSWSWASIDGSTSFDFADLAPGEDRPASVEVLDASTKIEGSNPFGCITSGKIIIRASVVRATWNAENDGWMLNGTFAGPVETQHGDLKFLSRNGPSAQIAGTWHYDDVLNGIMPGPPLTPSDSWDSVILPRRVPNGHFMSTAHKNKQVHGEDLMETPFWKRGTYVPEELVLVKGSVRKIEEYYCEEWGETKVEVLVLAKAGREGGESTFRRVGVGFFGSWDAEAESVEVLTVV